MAAPAHIARENGKKGGRPKGSKNAATLEREKVQAALRQRTLQHADILFNSQLTLARGLTYLYKIEKYYEGAGKNRVLKRKKPQLVIAQWEIEAYLASELDEGDIDDKEATYYFITTKEPNNAAIDSMLDRTFGRPIQTTDITTGGEKFEMDDIRALLALLPKERQAELYGVITTILAEAEVRRGSEKV